MLEELERLERELHEPPVRGSVERLSELLHADFQEFGRSGRHFSRSDILRELPQEDGSSRVWSGGYTLQYATSESALVLYKSAHIEEDGSLNSFSVRSSFWVKDGGRWKMLFHQGTPTAPFEIQ